MIKINNWSVYINPEMRVGWPQYLEKHGTEYAICIEVVIDNVNYLFRISPTTLTLEEAIKLAASMKLVLP